jgi:hypothetical protein
MPRQGLYFMSGIGHPVLQSYAGSLGIGSRNGEAAAAASDGKVGITPGSNSPLGDLMTDVGATIANLDGAA